jgi:hypothetical protein
MPVRQIQASLNLTPEDEAELARVFGCKVTELPTALAPYASAALTEYAMMFLGQKVFTRGSDIREYRLLLIQQFLGKGIPDEAAVSRLFQSTTSESRALLRAVMSKYQSQSHGAAEQSIQKVLSQAKQDGEGGPWLITVDNTIIVERLNRALAEIDGTLDKVSKHEASVSTYQTKPSSFNTLCDRFSVSPKPKPAPKGAKRAAP